MIKLNWTHRSDFERRKQDEDEDEDGRFTKKASGTIYPKYFGFRSAQKGQVAYGGSVDGMDAVDKSEGTYSQPPSPDTTRPGKTEN